MNKLSLAAIALAMGLSSAGAQAQGLVRGSEEGARSGDKAAGPVGAVVGGVVGGVAGGITGLFAGDSRPKFREYVVTRNHPVIAVTKPVVVGGVVSNTDVLYDIPPQYGIVKYKYTYIDKKAVIVDPTNYKIVEIID